MSKLWITWLAVAMLAASTGCQAQKQVQSDVRDISAKLAKSEEQVTALDAEMKKMTYELNQIKALVTKLGNVVVDLQKAEEERKAAAEAAAARAKAVTKKTTVLPKNKRK